jgi:hypothetical protein
MRHLVPWIAGLLVACGSAGPLESNLQQRPPPGPAGSFGEDHRWDDGKAEVCRYAAEEMVEGEKRSFEAVSIVAAELFDPRQMVKKEKYEPSLVPVLKCNWFLRIPTGVYSYQQMASLFVRRSDALAMKAAFSSQEWCGQTFAEWRRDRPGLAAHSYWDGEGDQTYELDAELGADVLFYEQVPLWIRAHRPDAARSEKVQLVEKRLATSHCAAPKLVAATLTFHGRANDDAKKPLVVELARADRSDTFLLDEVFPFTLTEWRRSDGTTWKLVKSERVEYWKLNKNSDCAAPSK